MIRFLSPRQGGDPRLVSAQVRVTGITPPDAEGVLVVAITDARTGRRAWHELEMHRIGIGSGFLLSTPIRLVLRPGMLVSFTTSAWSSVDSVDQPYAHVSASGYVQRYSRGGGPDRRHRRASGAA